jgi:hypothetical protein
MIFPDQAICQENGGAVAKGTPAKVRHPGENLSGFLKKGHTPICFINLPAYPGHFLEFLFILIRDGTDKVHFMFQGKAEDIMIDLQTSRCVT